MALIPGRQEAHLQACCAPLRIRHDAPRVSEKKGFCQSIGSVGQSVQVGSPQTISRL